MELERIPTLGDVVKQPMRFRPAGVVAQAAPPLHVLPVRTRVASLQAVDPTATTDTRIPDPFAPENLRLDQSFLEAQLLIDDFGLELWD
jgi:hypothetical protein